ncbi:cupin domain-containing protein [Streptomyces sp. NPDC092369]|uniref:AraC family transcriptional regulator n=1 Tax=Streptomyces sp. NPDC092369 TaxID=3366015 RepID=UPI003824AC6F
MDILSNELSRARAEGAVFSVLHRVEPWGLQFAGTRPLTAHLLLHGSGWVEREGQEAARVEAGDVLLATAGAPYALVSAPGADAVPIGQAREAGSAPGPVGDASAIVMCGAYVLSGSVGEALLRSLPPFAIVRAADQTPAHRAAVELLAAEAAKDAEGQQVLLDRLLDVNLVYTLRAWWQTAEAAPGWYRALDSAHLRRVLEALHANPAHNWTLPAMAQLAGLSRAGFAAQFGRVVGVPPARYLTGLRMTRAEDALIGTDDTLAVIAADVGYSNEYAFATAFRRRHGRSPGRWRTEHRAAARGRDESKPAGPEHPSGGVRAPDAQR